MFRLISLLVVVGIMAVLWLTMADGVTGTCPAGATTTSLPVNVPKGLDRLVGC
ncbi:MAG: hypothetical protein U0Q22_11045 [Acidimicrobiales bacterium]